MMVEYIGKTLELQLTQYSSTYYEVICYGKGCHLFSRAFNSKERALAFFDQKVAEIHLLETWWHTYG